MVKLYTSGLESDLRVLHKKLNDINEVFSVNG